MQLKKLLALLLSAALALSLLAGCGGESVARSLLALLDGQYANVSVEMDPDLEADLRQAIRTAESENAGDDAAAIRAALETLLGSKVTFRKLGEGQQGDTAFDLIFYAGADPDKAAQAAYSQWNPILSNVPADGLYTAALAQVQTENGVWLLVQATVDKAGTVDKPDKDDEPDPVTIQGLSVTVSSTTSYKVGDKFDPDVLTVTATYSNGKHEIIDTSKYTATIDGTQADGYRFTTAQEYTVTVSFGGQNATATVEVIANPNGYYQDSDGTYFVTGTDGLQKLYNDLESADNFTTAKITLNSSVTLDANWKGEEISFSGELNGNGNTITMEDNRKQGLFNTNNGTVQDVDIQVNGTIYNSSYDVGAVAGENNGTIQNCEVILDGHSITETYEAGSVRGAGCAVGGIAGMNQGTISGCSVSMGTGKIAATLSCESGIAAAGGIAGSNTHGPWSDGTVTGCTVTGSGIITATLTASSTSEVATKIAAAGGLVGYNDSKGEVSGTYSGTITAQAGSDKASVPGANTPNTDTKGNAFAGTKIGYQAE